MEFLFFLFFSLNLLGSCRCVVNSVNPIHSVLWLVMAFFQGTCLLLLFGLEFLGMLFLIVYVGAIAVLFLFVVIILDVQESEITNSRGGSILFSSFVICWVGLSFSQVRPVPNTFFTDTVSYTNWGHTLAGYSHMQIFGIYRYDHYLDFFCRASLILLTAMIGAIVLTLHVRGITRGQDVYEQTFRNFDKSIQIVQIKKELLN